MSARGPHFCAKSLCADLHKVPTHILIFKHVCGLPPPRTHIFHVGVPGHSVACQAFCPQCGVARKHQFQTTGTSRKDLALECCPLPVRTPPGIPMYMYRIGAWTSSSGEAARSVAHLARRGSAPTAPLGDRVRSDREPMSGANSNIRHIVIFIVSHTFWDGWMKELGSFSSQGCKWFVRLTFLIVRFRLIGQGVVTLWPAGHL
jgi:hypothetical protein